MKKEHLPISCQKHVLFQELINKKILNSIVISGKLCPRCNQFIEKYGGCDHVCCICGTTFCWKCLNIFGVGQSYKHDCSIQALPLSISNEILEKASFLFVSKSTSFNQFNENIVKLETLLPGSVNLILNDQRFPNVLETINSNIHKINAKAPTLDNALFNKIIHKFLKVCYDDLENSFLISVFLALLDSQKINFFDILNRIEDITETYYQTLKFVQTLDDLAKLIIERKKLRNRLISIKMNKEFFE
jgi:hypothetical protein